MQITYFSCKTMSIMSQLNEINDKLMGYSSSSSRTTWMGASMQTMPQF
jgi:hypothetical protein